MLPDCSFVRPLCFKYRVVLGWLQGGVCLVSLLKAVFGFHLSTFNDCAFDVGQGGESLRVSPGAVFIDCRLCWLINFPFPFTSMCPGTQWIPTGTPLYARYWPLAIMRLANHLSSLGSGFCSCLMVTRESARLSIFVLCEIVHREAFPRPVFPFLRVMLIPPLLPVVVEFSIEQLLAFSKTGLPRLPVRLPPGNACSCHTCVDSALVCLECQPFQAVYLSFGFLGCLFFFAGEGGDCSQKTR